MATTVAAALVVGSGIAGAVWAAQQPPPALPRPVAGVAVPPSDVAAGAVEPGTAADTASPDPSTGSGISEPWLVEVGRRTGIPTRVLQAYALAQLRVAAEDPACGLAWPTLAGIGWVESHHGTYAGGWVGADGRPTAPVVGIPLDGRPGVAAITDTDAGRLDGDPRWDRAVGPMQFIPSTWARWAADGDGDGAADPHQLDDAALAAGRYLCASDQDLTQGPGWRRAVLSYNASTEYADGVLGVADAYARDSRG